MNTEAELQMTEHYLRRENADDLFGALVRLLREASNYREHPGAEALERACQAAAEAIEACLPVASDRASGLAVEGQDAPEA